MIAQRVFYNNLKYNALKKIKFVDSIKEMKQSIKTFNFFVNAKNQNIKIEYFNVIKKENVANNEINNKKKRRERFR